MKHLVVIYLLVLLSCKHKDVPRITVTEDTVSTESLIRKKIDSLGAIYMIDTSSVLSTQFWWHDTVEGNAWYNPNTRSLVKKSSSKLVKRKDDNHLPSDPNFLNDSSLNYRDLVFWGQIDSVGWVSINLDSTIAIDTAAYYLRYYPGESLIGFNVKDTFLFFKNDSVFIPRKYIIYKLNN